MFTRRGFYLMGSWHTWREAAAALRDLALCALLVLGGSIVDIALL